MIVPPGPGGASVIRAAGSQPLCRCGNTFQCALAGTCAAQVMDKHLGLLCKRHIETKFVKVSALTKELAVRAAAAPLPWRGGGPGARDSPQHTYASVLCFALQINAEKSPFLTERLKIWMLPTLALIKNEKVEDYVVGFQVREGSRTEALRGAAPLEHGVTG